jgi:DNA gyrase subunit A
MVRLSKGYEALLTPFVDSKGNFGKVYSRDMAYAASRYTEAKLSPICAELFRDIERDTVDFVDNYDNTMQEPTLLPTTFPNILVSDNTGIGVAMASHICSFNLTEVCQTTIDFIANPDHNLLSTLKGPDFPTGGELLYDAHALDTIYRTGKGSVKVRAKWRYNKKENLIEIYEIPYSTTVEVIIDKVAELVKAGKIKDIADMRDETDLSGLKLAIDLKRGTNPDRLMAKLLKMTTLQDTISCNFNILIGSTPRVLGVREILVGLQKILLDIDKAIAIIRKTEEESEVVPNLMIGFGIDEAQAEYVAEIKLRNINREYILKRTDEISTLEKEIKELEETLSSVRRIRAIIVDELKNVMKKYGSERRTTIIYESDIEEDEPEEPVEDYPVNIFLSREGYFKKITPLSLRMGGEQKYKENDGPFLAFESQNKNDLLVFTDKQQVYKARGRDFEDTKASILGTYLPTALQMEPGENVVYLLDAGDYSGHIVFFFENGKAARVELSAYATKTNRKKLTGAYSGASPLVSVLLLKDDTEVALYSTEDRVVICSTSLIAPKTTRTTLGVAVMTLKKKYKLAKAVPLSDTSIQNHSRYRDRNIPAAGALLREEDLGHQQLALDI